MKRLLTLFLLTLLVSACDNVSQAEFDQHVAEFNQLQTSYNDLLGQLTTYSGAMYDWGSRFADAFCDVKEKNTPDQGPYASATNDFCGEGEPDPRDPPDTPAGGWGEA